MLLSFSDARAGPMARCRSAANDNPAVLELDFARSVLLRDALRHFAAHGPRAAELARSNAEAAFFAGERDGYLHWLAICRVLDRRSIDAAGSMPLFRSAPNLTNK